MKHDTELICFFWANDSHWNISTKMNDSLRYMFNWSPVQSKATLLANNSQHCWMLHVASVCIPCCMLLRVFGSCCSKFDTCQSFEPATPNISFVPWSPRHSATMLDPFATALPTLLETRTRITHSLQSPMGCNLPMMHRTSLHWLELLQPFAHHSRPQSPSFLSHVVWIVTN